MGDNRRLINFPLEKMVRLGVFVENVGSSLAGAVDDAAQSASC